MEKKVPGERASCMARRPIESRKIDGNFLALAIGPVIRDYGRHQHALFRVLSRTSNSKCDVQGPQLAVGCSIEQKDMKGEAQEGRELTGWDEVAGHGVDRSGKWR